MRIVDSHHHLWQLGPIRYPWLMDEPPMVSSPELIRDYLIDDFLADADGVGVVKTVHIEALPAPDDRVRETEFVQATADRPQSAGIPNAIVAALDLTSGGFAKTLDGHMQHRNLRGIRQILNPWAAPVGLMSDTGWRANLARLGEKGLRFDLSVEPSQMEEAVRMVAAVPNVAIALNHTGWVNPGEEGGMEAWRSGMRAMAACETVSVKISGFGMFGFTDTPAMRPIVLETIDLFGPDRSMFGSNYPVCKPRVGYRALWTSYNEITAHFSEAERERLFGGTAEAFYAI